MDNIKYHAILRIVPPLSDIHAMPRRNSGGGFPYQHILFTTDHTAIQSLGEKNKSHPNKY